jgi:methylase of polypeptide subunit release factors
MRNQNDKSLQNHLKSRNREPFGYTEERDSAFHNKYFLLRKEKTLELVKASSMEKSKKIKILDVGCGTAPISSNLTGKLREVYGVDISFLDLKEASQKGVITIRGDLTKTFQLKTTYLIVLWLLK